MGTVRADNYFIATNITDTASYVVKEPDGNIKAIGKFPDKNHVDPAMTNMCNATLYDLTMTVAPDNQKNSCQLPFGGHAANYQSRQRTFSHPDGNQCLSK